jgi:APA family basic amino acid/polyamine antiporter
MDKKPVATDGQATGLPRVLGPVAALCVVVGSVIGSGIFIVPAEVARDVPALGLIALVWIVGGLFSTAGALTLAELGAMIPRAGGLYAYLRAAYGPLPAFLFGWTEFLVIRTGSMATLAAAFARAFAQVVPPPESIRPEVWQAVAAVAAVASVATINVLGASVGGRVQVVGTVLKVGGVLALLSLPFVLGGGNVAHLSPAWPERFEVSLLSGMTAAMVGVLWAYDGWVNLPSLAEEMREPEKNLPRALKLGMAVLIALYLGMTLAYHYVLPFPAIAAAGQGRQLGGIVAGIYCHALLGRSGLVAISLLVMCSTFISLNGNALTGPRAYFAMARDGLFPEQLCRIDPRFRTPANAILAQCGWSIILTIVGTFLIITPPVQDLGLPGPILSAWTKLNETPLYSLLFTYVIFAATLFNTLAIASVFVLRIREPERPRSYRTWGYPLTPLLYVAAALILLVDMLWHKRAESLAGLVIVLLGLPAYWAFTRRGSGTSGRGSR